MPVNELPDRRQGRSAALLLRFVSVGGSTAGLYLGITFFLVEGLALPAVMASTVACSLAMLYNYSMHYHWTFGSEAPHGRVLGRYLVMCAIALVLNGLTMHGGIHWFDLHYMATQVIAAFITVAWSISAGSLWVYRD